MGIVSAVFSPGLPVPHLREALLFKHVTLIMRGFAACYMRDRVDICASAGNHYVCSPYDSLHACLQHISTNNYLQCMQVLAGWWRARLAGHLQAEPHVVQPGTGQGDCG